MDHPTTVFLLLATVVETKELLQTVAAALVAGVGVTIVFSLAIYGATRFADLSRDERPIAGAAAGALTFLALLVTVAAVVVGVVAMAQK